MIFRSKMFVSSVVVLSLFGTVPAFALEEDISDDVVSNENVGFENNEVLDENVDDAVDLQSEEGLQSEEQIVDEPVFEEVAPSQENTPSQENNATFSEDFETSDLENLTISNDIVKNFDKNVIINKLLNLKNSGVKSVYGKDRYKTSDKISDLICVKEFKNCDTVFLASGENFPDGIAISALAGSRNTAALLTKGNTLSDSVSAFLTRNNVKNVVIAGGAGSVSVNVENQIKNKGINVSRISGKDRYSTAFNIASHLTESNNVYLTSGQNWPDALVASAVAGREKAPILLTHDNTVDSIIVEYFNNPSNVGKNVIIVGGKWSNDKQDLLRRISGGKVSVYAGKDRYETAAKLNKAKGVANLNAPSLAVSGRVFADALSAGPLAATVGTLLIPAKQDCVTADVKNTVHSLGVINVGGPSVVGANAVSKVCSQTPSKPSAGWLQEFRSILDSYGGKNVKISELNRLCAGVKVLACSNSSGEILFSKELSKTSRSYKEWVVMHEYAHIYQFKIMDKIVNSSAFKQYFHSDIELLANAMAVVKGKNYYNSYFSSAQLNVAKNVWSGKI